MADEKPKDSIGIGIDPEQLNDLLKLLRARPKLLDEDSPDLAETETGLPGQRWKALTNAVAALIASQKTQAQKEAAETNRVDTTAANTWLKEHWPLPRRCPICSQDNWGLSPTFAHLPEGLIGRGPVGTYQPVRSIPLVVLTCRTCGNTVLLNAIVMGLLPEKAE